MKDHLAPVTIGIARAWLSLLKSRLAHWWSPFSEIVPHQEEDSHEIQFQLASDSTVPAHRAGANNYFSLAVTADIR